MATVLGHSAYRPIGHAQYPRRTTVRCQNDAMATYQHAETDPACAVAHGAPDADQVAQRTLIAVFASPVAEFLLRYGRDIGYRPVLLEPDPQRAITDVTAVTRA